MSHLSTRGRTAVRTIGAAVAAVSIVIGVVDGGGLGLAAALTGAVVLLLISIGR
ncbi:hypothetical protein [Amycolatopsis sp. ATCC 39116]|uniref:hypothetical protein n=1 Tax=Amycolatopsis sp. (strain ATCC 39116 / 75iv2) TaxID=385957 RepID=UPI0002DD5682|nr:hypothetical protein [Amycolatopsis sp. ATCC 39116]